MEVRDINEVLRNPRILASYDYVTITYTFHGAHPGFAAPGKFAANHVRNGKFDGKYEIYKIIARKGSHLVLYQHLKPKPQPKPAPKPALKVTPPKGVIPEKKLIPTPRLPLRPISNGFKDQNQHVLPVKRVPGEPDVTLPATETLKERPYLLRKFDKVGIKLKDGRTIYTSGFYAYIQLANNKIKRSDVERIFVPGREQTPRPPHGVIPEKGVIPQPKLTPKPVPKPKPQPKPAPKPIPKPVVKPEPKPKESPVLKKLERNTGVKEVPAPKPPEKKPPVLPKPQLVKPAPKPALKPAPKPPTGEAIRITTTAVQPQRNDELLKYLVIALVILALVKR